MDVNENYLLPNRPARQTYIGRFGKFPFNILLLWQQLITVCHKREAAGSSSFTIHRYSVDWSWLKKSWIHADRGKDKNKYCFSDETEKSESSFLVVVLYRTSELRLALD